MRERTGVHDERRRPAPRLVDELDELALVVGLMVLELETAARRLLVGGGDVIGQPGVAVDLGLALAQEVEVRPRQENHQ